jgi:Protoglobin
MQYISPSSLTHLPSRIEYLQCFLDFKPEDGTKVTSLKPLLAPLLPTLLDAVYTHLLSYDITARSFLPPQTSTTSETGIDEVDVTALHLDHANIKHRKDFLRAYLVRLLNNRDWSPESKFWEYLNKVGVVHTGRERTARKNVLRVEYVHIALLLGWLQDQIVGVVMGVDENEGVGEGEEMWTVERKTEVLSALGKFWWVQNDLFARHYCEVVDLKEAAEEERRSGGVWESEAVKLGAVAAAGVMTGALLVGYLLA